MRGRGRGNSRGRGSSRGRGDRSKNNKPQRKTLSDYTYYIGSSKQSADYEVVTQFIINHIKKTYEHGNDKSGDAAATDKLIEKTYRRFSAYLYLNNAKQDKYGSLLSTLNTQKTLGNEQYPATVGDANNVLSNHRPDNH